MRAFTIFVLIGVLLAGAGTAPQSAEAMNKAELIDSIASEADITKADSKKALDAFIDTTTKTLKKGDRVSLVGFGSFIVKKRSERARENGRKTVKVQFRANDGQSNTPEHADLPGETVTQDELAEMMLQTIDADADGDGSSDPNRIVDRFFDVFANVVHDTLADGKRVSLGEDEFGVFYLPMNEGPEEKERGITINVRHQLADIDDTIGEVQETLAGCDAEVCALVLESSDQREKLIAEADHAARDGDLDLESVWETLEKVRHIVRGDIEQIERALSGARELSDADEKALLRALQLEKTLDKKITKLQRLLDKGHNKHKRKERTPQADSSDVKRYNEIANAVFTIKDNESDEEYFVHATGLIDEIRDDDEVTFELKEGRKGMNAVNVQRTRTDDDDNDGLSDDKEKYIGAINDDDSDGDGIGDVVAELAKEYDGKAVVGKVDVDNNPEGTDNERSERKGRNPQTGKEIKIPAKKVVKFKPGAELSNKVK